MPIHDILSLISTFRLSYIWCFLYCFIATGPANDLIARERRTVAVGGQRTDRPKTRNGETSPFTCKEARPANGHPPPANFRGELASKPRRSLSFVRGQRLRARSKRGRAKAANEEIEGERATASARLGPSSEPQAPCSFPPPLSPSPRWPWLRSGGGRGRRQTLTG